MATNGTLAAQASRPERDDLRLQDIWHAIVRHRWLALAIAATVVAATALGTWWMRPVYEGEATLRMLEDAGSNPLGNLQALAPGAGGGKLETNMVVLRSRGVAESVVDSLALGLVLLDPAVPRSQLLSVHTVGGPMPAGEYELKAEGNGSYRLSAADRHPGLTLPATVRPGQPFRLGRVLVQVLAPAGGKAPDHIRFELEPLAKAVGELRENTVVSRPEPVAQVLSVRYRSTDPQLAAAVPNAMSAIFMRATTAGKRASSEGTVEFLREQVRSYENELHGAEEHLKEFREQAQVVSLKDEASEQVKHLAELQAQRDAQRSEREALAQLVNRVAAARGRTGSTSEYRQLASFPVFLANQAVQNILLSLNQLENQRANLVILRTDKDPDVQGLDARIGQLELQLYQIARNYLESLDSQLASSETALQRFGGQLEAIPAREVQYARLMRQQELLTQIYTLLQTRLKETEVQEAAQASDVRPIDQAAVPDQPIAPRPARNMGLAVVLGLLLGAGGAVLREAANTRVRDKDDASEATDGTPIVGTIPRIRLGNGAGRGRRGVTPGTPEELAQASLITSVEPSNPASEAYRALRTSVTFLGGDRPPQVMVVTSAMPGDGKSTTSVNLAIALAQQGVNTLLVDGDLRKGVMHRLLGLPQDPGLSHLLLGRKSLDEVVHEYPLAGYPPLHFVSSGVFPPNPAELLGSERLRVLLDEMRGRFSTVIIDAPPVNLVTDASILGRHADATLLVTRAGVTDRRALRHAAEQLRHLRSPVAGLILNDFDTTSSGYSYGYGYGNGTAAKTG